MLMKLVKKRHIFVFTLALFAAMSVAAFSLAGYFSSSLQMGLSQNFSSQAVARESKAYLVVRAKSQNKFEAQTLASDFPDACGYVWSEGEYHFVVHCAKERENDATLVKNSLVESGQNATVITICFPSFVIEEAFSPESLGIVNEAISSFFVCFRTLDDLSVGMQTGVYSYADCEQKTQKLSENCKKISEKYAQNFNLCENDKIVELGNYLDDLLECVMLSPIESKALERAAVEILDIYRFMASDLS